MKKIKKARPDTQKERGITMETVLYTVSEVSKLLKTNANYVYELIKKGYLPALKLGCYKVRKVSIDDFLQKYEGKDLTNLDFIKNLELEEITNEKC